MKLNLYLESQWNPFYSSILIDEITKIYFSWYCFSIVSQMVAFKRFFVVYLEAKHIVEILYCNFFCEIVMT